MAHTRIRHRTCEVKQPPHARREHHHAARLHNAGGIRVGAHGLAPTRFTGLCRALSPPRKRNLVAVVLSELSFLRAGMASLPKSELDELTRMPKPTGYGIRPHACAHISYSVHNPTCYYTPRTVHYYKYTATYVVRACTDPGHSVHGRGGRRPWCVEPGAGACVPEAES